MGNATQVRIRSEGPSTGTIARRAPTSLAYGQMFVFLRFQSMFFIQFNLHLMGRTVNNQAVIFKGNKTSLLDFVRFLRSIWGAGPTRRGMFHDTEVNHANLCLVVDCFTGEIHQSREAGPPERPQPEARRPLAQSRPPTAPKKTLGRRKPSFSSLCSSQTTRAPTR